MAKKGDGKKNQAAVNCGQKRPPFPYKRDPKRRIKLDRLMGQKFGRWTVVGLEFKNTRLWKAPCKCDCGREQDVHTSSLFAGTSTQCRWCASNAHRFQIGEVFGEWVVSGISERPVKGENGRRIKCRCSCGHVQTICASSLTSGKSKRCTGCSDRRRWKGITEAYWSKTVTSARMRGLQITVNWEQAKAIYDAQGGLCALSGVPISLPQDAYQFQSGNYTASADRIDNDKGYIAGNVQWVHKRLNIMKHTMIQDDFINWCQLVASNSSGRKSTPTEGMCHV